MDEQKIAEPICDYLCHGEGEKPCAKYGTALCHLDNTIKKQLALIAEDRAGLVEALKFVVDREHLMFAECSDAEEILRVCKAAIEGRK